MEEEKGRSVPTFILPIAWTYQALQKKKKKKIVKVSLKILPDIEVDLRK